MMQRVVQQTKRQDVETERVAIEQIVEGVHRAGQKVTPRSVLKWDLETLRQR